MSKLLLLLDFSSCSLLVFVNSFLGLLCIAFTVPEDIFLNFKEYLVRNNLKQGLFLLNYIKRVLAEDAEAKSE